MAAPGCGTTGKGEGRGRRSRSWGGGGRGARGPDGGGGAGSTTGDSCLASREGFPHQYPHGHLTLTRLGARTLPPPPPRSPRPRELPEAPACALPASARSARPGRVLQGLCRRSSGAGRSRRRTERPGTGRAGRRRLPHHTPPALPPGPRRPGVAPRPRGTFSFPKTSTAALNTASSPSSSLPPPPPTATRPAMFRARSRAPPAPGADWPARPPIKRRPRTPPAHRRRPGGGGAPSLRHPHRAFPLGRASAHASAPPRRPTSRKRAEPGRALGRPLAAPPAGGEGREHGGESVLQERALLHRSVSPREDEGKPWTGRNWSLNVPSSKAVLCLRFPTFPAGVDGGFVGSNPAPAPQLCDFGQVT